MVVIELNEEQKKLLIDKRKDKYAFGAMVGQANGISIEFQKNFHDALRETINNWKDVMDTLDALAVEELEKVQQETTTTEDFTDFADL